MSRAHDSAGAGGSYLKSLSDEPAAAGIEGSQKRRIVAEFADHLECDPEAELGSPVVLARQFADELGTELARRAALRAFAALAFAGLLFGVAVLTGGRLQPVVHAGASRPVMLVLLVCLLASQVAFVAGGLGLVRALRLRREAVMPRAEAVVLARRAGVGIAAGVLTLLALPVLALAHPDLYSPGWRLFAWAAAGAGSVALLVAARSVRAATRLRPSSPGTAGDLLSDLGRFAPRRLTCDPWRLALLVAVALAATVALAGIVASDPYDGIIRGVLEAVACLAGFALLGRYLGLRTQ